MQPKTKAEWKQYLERRYGAQFTEAAVGLVWEAALKEMFPGDQGIATILKTKHLLAPMLNEGGILSKLELRGGFMRQGEPAEEVCERDANMDVFAMDVFPQFSQELEMCMQNALVVSKDQPVTDLHIGVALISSGAAAIDWILRHGGSSIEEVNLLLGKSAHTMKRDRSSPIPASWSNPDNPMSPTVAEAHLDAFEIGLEGLAGELGARFTNEVKDYLREAYMFGTPNGITGIRLVLGAFRYGMRADGLFRRLVEVAGPEAWMNVERKAEFAMQQSPENNEIEGSGAFISAVAKRVLRDAWGKKRGRNSKLQPEEVLRALVQVRPQECTALQFDIRSFWDVFNEWLYRAATPNEAPEEGSENLTSVASVSGKLKSPKTLWEVRDQFPMSAGTLEFVEWMNRRGIDQNAVGAIGPRALLSFLCGWEQNQNDPLTRFVQREFPVEAEELTSSAIAHLEQFEVSGFPYVTAQSEEIFSEAQTLIKLLRREKIEPHHLFAALLLRATKDSAPDAFLGLEPGRLKELQKSFLKYIKESGSGEARAYWDLAFAEVLNPKERSAREPSELGPKPLTDSVSKDTPTDTRAASWENITPSHALWVELASRSIGVPHPIPDGEEGATVQTIYSFFGRIRELMTQHPAAREFHTVALQFLDDVLRPFTTRWKSSSTIDGNSVIADDRKAAFRAEHSELQVKAFGIRKALEALKTERMYNPRWIQPDTEMLATLQSEFRGAHIPSRETVKTSEPRTSVTIPTGEKIVATREAKERELCLDIDAYAHAIADTFTSAAEENDFVFALYGPWGRGKSTMIKRVTTFLQKDSAETTAPRDYAPIFFSAWKYPTRPEVWVHLYQKIAEGAQHGGIWQKLRVGFRIGLLKNGWWRLFSGFGLLAVSRLQIDFAHWLFGGLGIIGLLILLSFVWNAAKLGKTLGRSYFSMPDHAERLGLQAVIGEDLNTLLKVWIKPRGASGEELGKKAAICDFSRWWPARCSMVGVVILIWTILALVGWKVHRQISAETNTSSASSVALAQPASLTSQPSANILAGTTSGLPVRIDFIAEWKGSELQWTGSAIAGSAMQTGVHEPNDNPLLLLNWVLGGLAFVTPVLALLIAWTPKQYERVLLIVDDLDRCEPDQMLALIESLRLFLDDEDMSRRLQVAMLIDRKILYRAIIGRAETSKLLQEKDSSQTYFRQQEEKLFVVSLELPPLEPIQAEELADRIVNREYLEQLEAKIHATEAIAKEPHASSMRSGSAEDFTAAVWQQAAAKQEAERLQGERAAAERTSSPPQVGLAPLKDVTFSDEERKLLATAVTRIPVNELTPRSFRAFVLRYQLVRLILRRLAHPFPPDLVIRHLAASLFGNRDDVEAELDQKVRAAIGCVVGRDES